MSVYVLDTDVVSIGKKDFHHFVPPFKYRNAEAHIPLTSGRTDPFHAVVERRIIPNCFVLTDLNSTYGTYVNNEKVHNKSVKLVPGDVIRFGYGGRTFEFGVCQEDADNKKAEKHVVESGAIESLRRKRFFQSENVTSSNDDSKQPMRKSFQSTPTYPQWKTTENGSKSQIQSSTSSYDSTDFINKNIFDKYLGAASKTKEEPWWGLIFNKAWHWSARDDVLKLKKRLTAIFLLLGSVCGGDTLSRSTSNSEAGWNSCSMSNCKTFL